MNDYQIKKMARDSARWIASPEGQKTLREALKRAMETSNDLRKKRRVPQEILNRPFDI